MIVDRASITLLDPIVHWERLRLFILYRDYGLGTLHPRMQKACSLARNAEEKKEGSGSAEPAHCIIRRQFRAAEFHPYRNPQYPYIYPQIYNPSNAPPPAAMAYPATAPQMHAGFNVGQYPHTAPGFNFPGQPGHLLSGMPPLALIQFGMAPYPNVTVQQHPSIEWIPTTPTAAASLSERAVVAGYEGYDHSPLWVIRARLEGDLVPGKLAINHKAAYVPWNGKENPVNNIEVLCASPSMVRWIESSNGCVPLGAVPAGNTVQGETLYVGRAKYQGSLTPGKRRRKPWAVWATAHGLAVQRASRLTVKNKFVWKIR
ncbi:hypothetical protein EVAR_2908_1 [Eumeta japonica]|uniref:Uncharacterized protein n=1 Tax=Eumeta variegata TaxID=151549 RepID=A0A4C1T0Y0_EUMVA|nr:hypothetical protein EVAR_2908_1 [Eumeta japonica]